MISNQLVKQTIMLFIKAAMWAAAAVAVLLIVKAGSANPPSMLAAQPPTATASIRPLSPLDTPTPTFVAVSPISPLATPTPVPTLALLPDHSISYTYKIINVYPHDHRSFTQGLIYLDGELYEGSGLYGQSSLRRVDLESGEVWQMLALPPQFFGEGITIWGDEIIQLTWKENAGFVYDKNTFELKRQFTYPTQGWGITHDGERLIMSDGSANLYFWDPETFTEIGRVEVFDDNGPVVRLNELEYINGEVYANVWQTYRIVRIDPATGHVVGSIDLHGIITGEPIDVLNGIAYDTEHDRLFVTGKLWPKLFEIELIPQE